MALVTTPENGPVRARRAAGSGTVEDGTRLAPGHRRADSEERSRADSEERSDSE